jgi:nicotinate-nucleotide adenylyltransferase
MNQETITTARQIGFFGGSFNPIHNGHIALARSLLEAAGLDEVWFVVSPQNPFKQNSDLLDDAARMAMVTAALEGEPRLKPCGVELTMPRPSYTWHTLCRLRSEHPGLQFTLLIGGDNWERFDRWYHSADILATCRIVVYPRRAQGCGGPIDAGSLPGGVTMADTPLIDISSTEVRRRVAEGLPIDTLVPPAVAAMISKQGWYAANADACRGNRS